MNEEEDKKVKELSTLLLNVNRELKTLPPVLQEQFRNSKELQAVLLETKREINRLMDS